MGCDTKGIIATEEKNSFLIWRDIKNALYEKMQIETGEDGFRAYWKDGFSCPRCEIADFTEMLTITFEYKGEDRQMSVFLTCDHDDEEIYKGNKIILSLGMWGSSVELIETVLLKLKKYGKVWIMPNDCGEEVREL